MQEYRASRATDAWALIVRGRQDDVINAVVAPEPFMAVGQPCPNRPVVKKRRAIITPAHDWPDRQRSAESADPRQAICPEKGSVQTIAADRRCMIAFPLLARHASFADRGENGRLACLKSREMGSIRDGPSTNNEGRDLPG